MSTGKGGKMNGWRAGKQDSPKVALAIASTTPKLSDFSKNDTSHSMTFLRNENNSEQTTIHGNLTLEVHFYKDWEARKPGGSRAGHVSRAVAT